MNDEARRAIERSDTTEDHPRCRDICGARGKLRKRSDARARALQECAGQNRICLHGKRVGIRDRQIVASDDHVFAVGERALCKRGVFGWCHGVVGPG